MEANRFNFRAWDAGQKQMHHRVQNTYDWKYYINHPENLMQSTGLLDKNGREIFEGDILQDAHFSHWRGAVSFNDARFRWDFGEEWGEINETAVSVIGNIYENPELLKETSK